MAKLQKYLFDQDFGNPFARAAQEYQAASVLDQDDDLPMMDEEPPPPPPTFSEDDLQLAREQAYEAGRMAGIAEAEMTTERLEADALDAVAHYLREIDAAQIQANEQILKDSVSVALAVVRKMLPEMARAYGLDEMEALIRECLAQLDEDVKVTIRVHPDLIEGLRARAEAAAQAAAFEGKLLFAPDPRRGRGACRVEWGDGGAERDQTRIWTEIEGIIARTLGEAQSMGDGPLHQTAG